MTGRILWFFAGIARIPQNLPTSFALPDETVDRLRNAAAQVLRDSPAFREFVASLFARP